MTQGDTLTIIAYGIGIIPLIKNIKREIPDVTQPWYAEDAGTLGTFARLAKYFDSLTRQVPGRTYYPELSNSVLIIRLKNLESGKEFGTRHGFKGCAGTHYLGGYIGGVDSKHNWMRERTLTWEGNINTIRKTTGKHPQDNYAAAVYAIQSKCISLQHVTWDMGYAFAGVEKMIWENVLPRIFFGKTKTLPPIVGALSTMLVKKDGLGLLSPVNSSLDKYLISPRGSTELIWAVMGGGELSNADHLRTLGEERRGGKKDQEAAYKTKLKGLLRYLKVTNRRLILRAKSIGAWMSVSGTTVSGTVLSATEFWYFLCTCYNVSPLNLQSQCNRCGTTFGVTHTLSCGTGVLVIARHNEIRENSSIYPGMP